MTSNDCGKPLHRAALTNDLNGNHLAMLHVYILLVRCRVSDKVPE